MTLALISGFLQAPEDLLELEHALQKRDFEVDTCDILSLLREDDAASAIARLCERFRHTSHWVGYSMGARLALCALPIAHARQQAPAGLVLISGSPGIEEEADRHARRQIDRARADALCTDPQQFIRDWGELPLFDSVRGDASFAALQHRRQCRVQAQWADHWAHALDQLGPGALESQWRALPHAPCPLLFLAGGRDSKYVDIAERAAQIASGAKARILADAGHALALECAEQVADEIEVFVRDHPAAIRDSAPTDRPSARPKKRKGIAS